MLYYDRNDLSEKMDVNKTSKSKECDIFHCLYCLDKGLKFQPDICNKCHDVLMMSTNLYDIAILNIHGAHYRCIMKEISKKNVKRLLL